MRRLFLFTTVIACLCLSTVNATAMTVDKGLVPYQVIQCNNEGRGSVSLAGTSGAAGMVQLRLVGVQKEVFPWIDLGKTPGGEWTASFDGVPAGGPYRVELRLMDDSGKTLEQTAIPEVLIGDVWVLAGQSNMQGVGNRVNVEEPHPQVHTFAMNYEWRLAQEPLHTLAESPDSVHANFKTDEERQKAISDWRDGAKGAGLGITFAKEMVKRTGRPVGLIASAHGGTSMAQWNPALRDEGGNSLYGSMCKQVLAAGGKVRGVLWYQGESDANKDGQPVYREKMKQLVAAMRADSGIPDLPFYYVQIGRFTGKSDAFPTWNAIQTDELALEADLAPGAMTPAVDLALNDGIHVGTPGHKTLGYRLANLAEHDLFAGKTLRGPRLEKIEVAHTPYGGQVRVKYNSVNGALAAAGRLSGFTISEGPEGSDAPCIFNQELDPKDPTVAIVWFDNLPNNPQLWYGRGLNPYCNLVDQANMAAPVMGPIPIKE